MSKLRRDAWVAVFVAVALSGSVLVAHAQDEADTIEVPFHMPVPEGWRTETIPFPLAFAPSIEIEGLEELRFAPGMFDAEAVDYWTYAFVWWVPLETTLDAKTMQSDLKIYFDGLVNAVAEARDFDVGDEQATVEIRAAEDAESRFTGTARTLDAFATREMVTLNMQIDMWQCPQQDRRVVFFALSPQPMQHEVWKTLTTIRTGFRCDKEQATGE